MIYPYISNIHLTFIFSNAYSYPHLYHNFAFRMNRSSKMRSSNYYSNSQLQAQGGKVGEVQHRSIEQSFTEEEGDSEAEPALKTKNTFYELQSKCNNLEYEKIKSEMAYKNIVS